MHILEVHQVFWDVYYKKGLKNHTCMCLRYGMGYMNRSFSLSLLCVGFWPHSSVVAYIRCLGHIRSLHSRICRESHERVLDTDRMRTLRIYVMWIMFHVNVMIHSIKNVLPKTWYINFENQLPTLA